MSPRAGDVDVDAKAFWTVSAGAFKAGCLVVVVRSLVKCA
jgi:hypothetical protein